MVSIISLLTILVLSIMITRAYELQVEPEDWMANQTLQDLDLRHERVLVLGITRGDGTYIGAPRGKTKIQPNDTLVLNGRRGVMQNLDRRRKGMAGEQEHRRAVNEQEEVTLQEQARDRAQKGGKPQEGSEK